MNTTASRPSFYHRHRRTINLWTFFTFLLTTLITLLTPPTFQAITLIRLPSGVTADQFAVHLQTYAQEVVPPDSHPLTDFRFLVKPVGHDSPAVGALIVEGQYANSLAGVAEAWATIAVGKLGGQASILTHAQQPQYAIRPKKAQNEVAGIILGLLIGFGIAGLKESFRLMDERELALIGSPDAVSTEIEAGKGRTRKRVRRRLSPWRRTRRTITLWTFWTFLVCLVITLFTPPTCETSAMIELPPGVTVAQVSEQLKAEAWKLSPPASVPSLRVNFLVRPIGHDTPEFASLVVQGGPEHADAYAELADEWASAAVATLGDKAAVQTHAERAIAVRPKRTQNIVFGIFLGFVVGCVVAGFRLSMKPKIVPISAANPDRSIE